MSPFPPHNRSHPCLILSNNNNNNNSYALILWSMASGKRPFSGMGEDGADLTPFQVMMKVVSEKLRPPMPDTLPEGIADLIRSCWEQTPEARPNAEMVLDILAVLMEAFSKKQQKQ